jgi:hypothetical protein
MLGAASAFKAELESEGELAWGALARELELEFETGVP